MTRASLHFAALRFLDQWFGTEAAIREGLLSTHPEKQRKAIVDGAAFFGIARNLPKCHDVHARRPKLRFRPVVDAAAKHRRPITDPDTAVADFTTALSASYGGTRVTSAASKILWLIHRDPVVIYDSRARNALGFTTACSYAVYRHAWEQRWSEQATAIRAACRELPTVLRFAACGTQVTRKTVVELAATTWFQRRVLDIALWSEGQNTSKRAQA